MKEDGWPGVAELRSGRVRSLPKAARVPASERLEYAPPVVAESRRLPGSWYCGSDRLGVESARRPGLQGRGQRGRHSPAKKTPTAPTKESLHGYQDPYHADWQVGDPSQARGDDRATR